MKKIILIILGVLLIYLTIFPRTAEILSGNYLFGYDQGRDYLAVKDIVINHKLTLIGSEIGGGFAGFQGIFHGPFHYYFLTIPFLLFNGNPYGSIILMFTYGVLTIILGYFLGKRIFGHNWGIIFALLIGMSPPLISASRFLWNTHGSPIFILLAFYCVYLITLKNNLEKKYIFLAGFFSAFIYNFQLGIALPMCFALFIFCLFIARFSKLKQYLFLFLGFMMGFLPMILFEAKHKFAMIKGFSSYILGAEKFGVTQKFIELNLKDHLGVFMYNFFDSFPKQNLIKGEFLMFFLLSLVVYYLFLEKNGKLKKFIFYLLFLPPSSFLVFSFLRGGMYVYYLMNLNLVYLLLFVYVIFSSYQKKNIFLKTTVFALTIFLFFQASIYAFNNFSQDYFDHGGTAKIRGKTETLDFIYKDAKKEKFSLLVFTPPVYTYAYDYLLWWYGQRKYNYLPSQEKQGPFYLLIEKDGAKPWSYNGWLETVIKTGKVLRTIQLPNGFIIQKRLGENNDI